MRYQQNAFSRILSLGVLAGILCTTPVSAAASQDIRVSVNGQILSLRDTSPFIQGGRTYVPLRPVLEAYGVDSVDWNAPNVIVKKGDIRLVIPVGEKYILQNDRKMPSDAAALIQQEHTYLPIRTVIEALGGSVTWDSPKRTVLIATPESKPAVTSNQIATPSQATTPSVIMIADVGGLNDESFNQSGWEGLQRLQKDLGLPVKALESTQEADYALNIDAASAEKPRLICAIGFMLTPAVCDASAKYPAQRFAIMDSDMGDSIPKNVVGAVFRDEESSFLVGYIAGKMTKTNTVAFLGGMDFPVINTFEYGFRAGVKAANPKCKVLTEYAGSFADFEKGRTIAAKLFTSGADIIYHAAGATGNGMIEEAKTEGKYAIGVDADQSSLAPDTVITSAIKSIGNAAYQLSKDMNNGIFAGGTTISYGLEENGVDIAPSSSRLVPAAILKEVDVMKDKIIRREIIVPTTREEFEQWTP